MGTNISKENGAKRQKTANIHMDDIPNEIFMKVLKNLDITDVLKCAQVCKRLNSICMDETVYRITDLSERKVSTKLIELVLNRGCKDLNLHHSRLENDLS